jgi:hypothetical protein
VRKRFADFRRHIRALPVAQELLVLKRKPKRLSWPSDRSAAESGLASRLIPLLSNASWSTPETSPRRESVETSDETRPTRRRGIDQREADFAIGEAVRWRSSLALSPANA